jgi:hypothetical protein
MTDKWKQPPFDEADCVVKVTEDDQSDIPNIIKGCEVYIKLQDTAKAGTFVVMPDMKITQLKEDAKVYGEILILTQSMGDHSPVIHNGNNWFSYSPEQMEEINKEYPFRSQADIDTYNKRLEEKFTLV